MDHSRVYVAPGKCPRLFLSFLYRYCMLYYYYRSILTVASPTHLFSLLCPSLKLRCFADAEDAGHAMIYGAMHAESPQKKPHQAHYNHFFGGLFVNLLRLLVSLSVSEVSSLREPRLELLILKVSCLIKERPSRFGVGLLFELRKVNVSSLIKDRSPRGGR